MISDAEFWMEIRRKQGGGNEIFRSMLALLHARQVRLDACVGSLDREETMLVTAGKERRDIVDGKQLSSEEKKAAEEAKKRQQKLLAEMEKPVEANKALQLHLKEPLPGPPRRVAAITIRVLQQVMMFAVPIYSLRYNIPAMSMSWNTSCFIDRPTKQLITFGAGQGVKVPQLLHGRGCVAGDGFFAILSDCDEVWASGGLKVSSSAVNGPTPLGREEVMTGIAAKTLMLVGHGQRLASVTRAFTVRSLSALSNPTRSIIPSRHVRFLDLGYGEDYYMIGTDSVVYKTMASKRAVSTPRRVMTLSHMPVSRISSGTSFLLIIDQNGHLYTLGRNRKGQLGNGEKQDARRKPYFQDSLSHHFFTQVAAGDCHSLALTSSGIVYGAGSNESGQLGLGIDTKEALVFTKIPLPQKCVGIAAGLAGSMFALEDGQVLSCGLNDCMQLGVESVNKIVYDPTPISILVAGVESYTMDFGGYRRPDPEENEGNEKSPSLDAAQVNPYGNAESAEAGGDAGNGRGGKSTVNPPQSNSGETPTKPAGSKANPQGDGGSTEPGDVPANNNSVHLNGATLVFANSPGENHEPVADPPILKAPKGGTKDSKPKVPKADGKANTADGKANSCKCCCVM